MAYYLMAVLLRGGGVRIKRYLEGDRKLKKYKNGKRPAKRRTFTFYLFCDIIQN
jgi:hypothetical protein